MGPRARLEQKCIDIYTKAFKGLFLYHVGRQRKLPATSEEWDPFLLEVLMAVKQEHPYPIKHQYFESIHALMTEGVRSADPQTILKMLNT